MPGLDWIASALSNVGNHFTPRLLDPPIFLDASTGLDTWDLEGFFQPATGGFWTSRLTRAPWLRRDDLTLPLRVVAAGPNADSWFEEVRKESWAQGKEFEQHGLQLHATDQDVSPLLHTVRPHVIVTTAPHGVMAAAAKMTQEDRPRLVVWLDDTLGTVAPTAAPEDVGGIALLRVANPAGGPGHLMRDLFLEFTHDVPLHQLARELAHSGHPQIRLTADPFSVQALRLHPALAQIRREAQRWETILPVPSAKLKKWINQTRKIENFLGESHGFVPITKLRASMDEIAMTVPQATKAPKAAETGERAAHVAVERLDTFPYLSPVNPTTSLAADSSYQIRLHIGSPLSDSLVENPEAVDPKLGPPDDREGYNLEVAIQGKEFAIESDRVVKLRLPLTGNSDPIYFEVRTPVTLGKKELRLCIYHRNYLVQSLLLEALIESAESEHTSRVTTVKVETSQAPNFADIDQLGERVLSIGVNAGQNGKTHDFVLKSNGSSDEVSLVGTTFKTMNDLIRKRLEAAARDPVSPKKPRSYAKIPRGGPIPADVANWIREFATFGRRLYSAFFDRIALTNSPLRPHLVGLASNSGERIQVFRFAYEDAFMWPLLYDWPLPKPSAPVCLGWTVDPSGKTIPCSHDATSGQYCIRGFWGVRHRVEEMLPGTAVKKVDSPATDKPVRLVADSGLPESAPLVASLTNDLGAAALAAGPVQPASLLDVLFKTTDARPALLILFGHHEHQSLPGGVKQSRIQLDAAPEWLSEEDVRSRAQQEIAPWVQPRSIIVMMACASSTTGAETLTDFTTAWNMCGAAAIVGTQCIVGAQLAADFARVFVTKTWKNKTNLGDTMAEIRADLLAEGNPLAFLFHAIGDIDLVLQ